MRQRLALVFATFLLACPWLVLANDTHAQDANSVNPLESLTHGVVVENVEKGFEAHKSGLREGDVLLRWSRGDMRGLIQSPFDLQFAEVEQAPRGTVTIEGLRSGHPRAWQLGENDWRIEARPSMTRTRLSRYRAGETLAKAGNLREASTRWHGLAGAARSTHPEWFRSWLMFHIAKSFVRVQRWKEADEAFREAIQPGGINATSMTYLLREWAETYRQRNVWSAAEESYQKALEASRAIGAETLVAGRILSRLGTLALNRDDLPRAADYYTQALTMRMKLAPVSLAVAGSLFGLGIVAEQRDDYPRAENYYQQALAIQEKIMPESLDVAGTLCGLADVAAWRGDLVKADGYFRQSLQIRRRLGPGSADLAAILNNMGDTAYERDDLEIAKEYFSQSLAIYERLSPGGIYSAAVLSSLGAVAERQGDLVKAEKSLLQALTIEEKLAPDSSERAQTLYRLGVLAHERGDQTKAEANYRQALALKQKQDSRPLLVAEILVNLAVVVRDRGDLVEAERHCRDALDIIETFVPSSTEHAEALALLADMMRRQGRLSEAVQLYEESLNILESHIARLGGASEVRANFRANHAIPYQEYLSLLIAQGKPRLAFQILERSRARTLLEMLNAARIDIRTGVDPGLLSMERDLQASLRSKISHRIQLLTKTRTEQQVTSIDNEIKDVTERYQDVEGQIRESSPSYAELTQPTPVTTHDVQQKLLDSNTLLLEYSLGAERSFVFAVTPDSLQAYELPKRAEIEELARSVYDILTARSKIRRGETEVRRLARLQRTEKRYPVVAGKLSRMILGPVMPLLGSKRLLIVADGVLEYVSFAALPAPVNGAEVVPIVVGHEIVNLPSASVLQLLRQQEPSRSRSSGEVAVLADPVFKASDSRVRALSRTIATKNKTAGSVLDSEPGKTVDSAERALRSLRQAGRNGEMTFSRLLYTRKEAQVIVQEAPPGRSMKATDFEASLATATSSQLARYRIVHFATHGLLNNQRPELSGLVLSLVNEKGKAQEGFLSLERIYNLRLSADLVVLSGCETALGKEVQGEGLVGLTRGFMYAGATRVLGTLWKVDDAATADLMEIFYRGMFRGGLQPATALRLAQIEMWKRKRWSSPFYWAGFTIQGEWK